MKGFKKFSELDKKAKIMAICGMSLFVIIVLLCATSNWRARRSLKHECGAGMDCVCFSNVVDNRLNMKQVRAFNAFLNSAKRRQAVNILEFTDDASARGISEAVALCRPAPVQQQPAQQPQKKGKK